LVGRLADELGSDAHGKPHNGSRRTGDRWFTRKASEWRSLCRGRCRGQEYCKEPHESAGKICFKQVYVGLAIALAALSC
jgi:hypothetical protein